MSKPPVASETHMPDLITRRDVCALLNVDRRTVRRIVERGELPCIRIANGTRLFKRDAVERLVAEREHGKAQ